MSMLLLILKNRSSPGRTSGVESWDPCAAVAQELARAGRRPVFLVNAGILERGGIPTGLLVPGGGTRSSRDEAGQGAFFLNADGVFLVTSTGPGMMEREEHARENTCA